MKSLTNILTILMLSICIAASPAAFAKKSYSSSKSYGKSYSSSSYSGSSYSSKKAKTDFYSSSKTKADPYKSSDTPSLSEQKKAVAGTKYDKKDLSSGYNSISSTQSMDKSKSAYKEALSGNSGLPVESAKKLMPQENLSLKSEKNGTYGGKKISAQNTGSISATESMNKSRNAYTLSSEKETKKVNKKTFDEGNGGQDKNKYSDELKRKVGDSNYTISKERPVVVNNNSSSLLDYAMGAYVASSILSSDNANSKTSEEIERLRKEIAKMNDQMNNGKELTQEEKAKLPKYKICSGKWDQNYYAVAQALKASSERIVNIDVVETKGSVDNLKKINSGECDFAIIQGDVVDDESLQKISLIKYPYSDTALLICSRESEIKNIKDVNDDTRLSLPQSGSGGYFTWNKIEKMFGLNPKKTSSVNASITSQMNDVKSGRADCMFTVGKTTSKAFVNANETMKMEDGNILVDITASKKILSNTVYTQANVEENKLFNVKNKTTIAGIDLWDRSAISLLVPNGVFVSNEVLAKDPSLMVKLSEVWGF